MTSATDIITYIGIPLAVLGVLPILYTFGLSILRERRVRRLLLAHGHVPQRGGTTAAGAGFVVRASPMTSLVEVEMPRYTVAPLGREDARYWDVAAESQDTETEGHHRVPLLERAESTLSMLEEGRVCGFLRGGSWRTFHWRTLVVGRKMYRIQYEDELREPPAEIGFAELVEFLMDWGVQLDGVGWGKLRSAGLWTPSGTVLLRVAPDDDTDIGSVSDEALVVDGKDGGAGNDINGPSTAATSVVGDRGGDWVLRTSMPDDSDGILTLCVRWPQRRGMGSARGATRLPPGWGRLRQPRVKTTQDNPTEDDTKQQDLSTVIAKLAEQNPHFAKSDSIRFKLAGGGGSSNNNSTITQIHHETNNKETGLTSDLTFPTTSGAAGWFTSATSAVLNLRKTAGSLWGFEPPAEIQTFTRRDTVPCGVLVLLGLLDDSSAPQWTSDHRHQDISSLGQQQLRAMETRRQAERLEATMSPEQARVHRANREASERQDQHRRMMDTLTQRREREHQRLRDALVSARMTNAAVAGVCLRWLVERGVVVEGSSLLEVAEAVLYLLVLQSQGATVSSNDDEKQERDESTTVIPTLRILEEWTNWSHAGGMKKEQYDLLEEHTVEFCYAACLVAVVHEAASLSSGRGRASVDMLECLKMWQKVRLG